MATKLPGAKTYASVDAAITALEKVLKEEVGYLEKKTNASLSSKTANAGYNNYTKYWNDLAVWGAMGNGYDSKFAGGPAWSWCAALMSWGYIMAFGLASAKKLLLHMPYTYCPALASKAGSKLTGTPKKGCIVLFYNGSTYSHTGWVYKVDSTTFYTIEGNTNDSKNVVPNGGKVCLKSYNISTYKSKGTKFFMPDYSAVVKKPAVTGATKASTTTTAKKTTTTQTVTVKTKTDPLICRKSASTTASAVGKFAKGTKLTLLEKTNTKWYKVKGVSTEKKTITGYCSTAYLG